MFSERTRAARRGQAERQGTLLLDMTTEDFIPASHPIRRIRVLADTVLERLSPKFTRLYSPLGRPSVPPERLIKGTLLLVTPYARPGKYFVHSASVRCRPAAKQTHDSVLYNRHMGEVTVRVKLSNLIDIELLARGEQISPRELEVEAIVDTGAIRSVIPARIAHALGLRILDGRPVGLADGSRVMAGRAEGLRFEILGRQVGEDALVLGDEVLIGQTTLESTDLVVDCANRTVYPNPANPDWVMKVRSMRP